MTGRARDVPGGRVGALARFEKRGEELMARTQQVDILIDSIALDSGKAKLFNELAA